MIIAATGHRPQRLNFEYSHNGPLSRWLKEETKKVLIEHKPDKVLSGMALGYDQIFAITALELNIPVIAAVPFRGQESRWPPNSQYLYRQILADPNVTVKEVSPPGYAVEKMFIRDYWMVDNCDKIVACWNGDKYGGTYKTVAYAQKTGRTIIRINPLDVGGVV